MAISTCVKCNNSFFDLKQAEPSGSAYKLFFVQCSKCGGVVGIQEYYNNGAVLENHGKALKAIASKVGAHVEL